MKFKWELIEEQTTSDMLWQSTYRAKVIGGWVLRMEMLVDDERQKELEGWSNAHNSLVFIPDPNHQWEVEIKE